MCHMRRRIHVSYEEEDTWHSSLLSIMRLLCSTCAHAVLQHDRFRV